MPKKVCVIGAGVGGLSAAARLAKSGFDVEVFEKLSGCGGRNNIIEDKGFKFDMGPSFVMMPDFFEEVFNYCGENIKDYLDLRALDPSYKIFYPDGDFLTVHKDSNRTKEELERIEPGASRGFDAFIEETSRIYAAVRPLLWKCFRPSAIFNPSYWPLLGKIKAFDSYWNLARKYFKSEKLVFAFTFEAMFMGVSPFDAPAFYSVISYSDHVQKIFHPMGGMYKIPVALENLGRKFGAKYRYNCEVTQIKKKAGGFTLKFRDREVYADKVIINADYAYAQTDILTRNIPDYKYSCSVYLLYLGLKAKVPGVAHHNLFFSSDLRRNLSQIFKEKVFPDDPSFYVHVPTVTDPMLAPVKRDLFYILVPVSNLKDSKDDLFKSDVRLRRIVFDRINKRLGIDLEKLIEVEHKFYPQDFIGRYNIKYGATFGLAHNLMQSAFFRPANFDRKLKGVYFVGASVQPGGGLPVVIAGSRIVADLINSGR